MMTGHHVTLQSRGPEKTETFTGPRVGRGDNSGCGSSIPLLCGLLVLMACPLTFAGRLCPVLVRLHMEVGEYLENLAFRGS